MLVFYCNAFSLFKIRSLTQDKLGETEDPTGMNNDGCGRDGIEVETDEFRYLFADAKHLNGKFW